MHHRALLLFAAFLLPSIARAEEDPCAGVTCSGHGQCFEERGLPACLCEEGFSAVSLSCTPGADEAAILRARRDPRAGQRVADLAMAEVGRRRADVGVDLAQHAQPLSQFLVPGEWWCGDFVSWIYDAAQVPLSGGAAGGWLVSNNVAIRAWFEARGMWIDRSSPRWSTFVPRPGDFVRFETDLGGHAAIVHHVSGDTIYAVEGNVGARVELERYYHFRTNHLIDGFGILALPHDPPVVEAPDDIEHAWRRPLLLRGSVTDDGPPELLAIAWTQAYGPGDARFDDPSAATTRCSFTAPGRYVLRLEASDGEHTIADDVAIDVLANRSPIVEAHLVELEDDSGLLRGSVDDDGPSSLRWTQVSGPARAVFAHADRADTRVSLPEPGAYVLRLSASDGELEASDDVYVERSEPMFGCAAAPGRGTPLPIFLLLLALALTRTARGRRARR